MKQGVVVGALGTAQALAWGSSYYLPAILADPIADGLGLSRTVVFGVFSGSLLVSALLGPSVGRAIDTRGGRGMLALSNLVLAAGLVLLALTQGVVTLVTAWTVLGVGMAMGLYDSAFATLAGLYGRAARGPITGITLIAGFASTVGWPLSALLDAHFGWRGACLVWAALNVLIGLPLNRLLIPEAPPPIRASEVQETAESAPRGAMALLAFVFAATWFVTGAMAAHLPRLLEIAGASTTAAIAAAALVGPAQVGARLVEFGALSRVHPVISARIAAALHPLGAGILAAFGAPVIVAFALFHGAGNGLLTIAKGTLPLAIFGPVGYTNAEIAVKIDFTPDYIAAICYLLEHGEERLLATVERGVMPANIAMEIARAPDGDIQQALAEAYENKLLPGNQILAIRRIILQRNQRRKSPPRTGRGVPNTGKITAAANLMFEIAIIERTGSAKSVWPRPEPLYAAGQDHSRPQQSSTCFSAGRLSTLTKVKPLLGQPVPSRTTPGKADREDEGGAAAGLARAAALDGDIG